MGMPAYVISLARTPERMQKFAAENEGLVDYQVSEGVDGAQLDLDQLRAEGVLDPGLTTRAGTIGLLFSHMNLRRKAVDEAQIITIFEDDALLHRNFAALSDELITTCGEFDWILWGLNLDSVLSAEILPRLGPCNLSLDTPFDH